MLYAAHDLHDAIMKTSWVKKSWSSRSAVTNWSRSA